MDKKTADLIDRIDSACRRMTAAVDSCNKAVIEEVEKLAAELGAERRKAAEYRLLLEKAEQEVQRLQTVETELVSLRDARLRDRKELDEILAELTPLLDSLDHA